MTISLEGFDAFFPDYMSEPSFPAPELPRSIAARQIVATTAVVTFSDAGRCAPCFAPADAAHPSPM
jgi:hypothetical protein